MAKQLTINLKSGHPDFVVKPNLGPIILWHGKTIDLRDVRRKDADAIAADPNSRYITYSEEYLAKIRPKPKGRSSKD
jgi:hypothetical protein